MWQKNIGMLGPIDKPAVIIGCWKISVRSSFLPLPKLFHQKGVLIKLLLLPEKGRSSFPKWNFFFTSVCYSRLLIGTW